MQLKISLKDIIDNKILTMLTYHSISGKISAFGYITEIGRYGLFFVKGLNYTSREIFLPYNEIIKVTVPYSENMYKFLENQLMIIKIITNLKDRPRGENK